VEQLGGEFLFHDGTRTMGYDALKNQVAAAHIVVFITSVNSHNAMHAAKKACRRSGARFRALRETGPHALQRALLQTGAETGNAPWETRR
jgi:hypothetical protein